MEPKIKEDYPKCYTDPRSSQLGSTTDQLDETTQRTRSSSSSSLSLVASPPRYHRHLQTGFGSICESRGLSNLTPTRSRLFKLIGRVKGMRWRCSKRLAYMVAKHMQMRTRREGKSTVEHLWSRSDPRTTYVNHNSNTVFTSWSPPKRDHHGYTRGWCILIKVNFRFSTTGH